jgi:hypothetical protein
VGGELGDESGIHAVIGKGNGHVGLSTAKGCFKFVALHKHRAVVLCKTNKAFCPSFSSHLFSEKTIYKTAN